MVGKEKVIEKRLDDIKMLYLNLSLAICNYTISESLSICLLKFTN